MTPDPKIRNPFFWNKRQLFRTDKNFIRENAPRRMCQKMTPDPESETELWQRNISRILPSEKNGKCITE